VVSGACCTNIYLTYYVGEQTTNDKFIEGKGAYNDGTMNQYQVGYNLLPTLLSYTFLTLLLFFINYFFHKKKVKPEDAFPRN